MDIRTITEQAVLVVPSISVWTARKYDRKASEEIATAHQAKSTSRAGRYNKLLVDTKGAYTEVTKASGELRLWVYRMTVPWLQDGTRVLPTALFEEFSTGWQTRFAEFEQAVTQFLAAYPDLRNQAARELNDLYRAEDYPAEAVLRSKFKASLAVLPFPSQTHFQTNLNSDQAEQVRDQLGATVVQAVETGTRDCYQRLGAAVSRMAERLANPTQIFRDSLVENVTEVCTLIPRLNLAGDEQLTQLCHEAAQRLTAHAPDVLRENTAIRATVAQQAADLTARLVGLYGPCEEMSEAMVS